jgi:hypothetical protein
LFAQVLSKLSLDRRVLVALDNDNGDNLVRAARNISFTTTTTVAQLNAWTSCKIARF